jgi:hypothetical protein
VGDTRRRPLLARPAHLVWAILGGVLGAYVVIAGMNNMQPPRAVHGPLPHGAVVQHKAFVNWVERGNRAKLASVVGHEIWTIAKTHPEATAACVDVLVAKEDLLDRWGNPLSKDVLLLEAVATKLDQVRKYPTPDAYVGDRNGAARWQERPCA